MKTTNFSKVKVGSTFFINDKRFIKMSTREAFGDGKKTLKPSDKVQINEN